MGPEHNRRTAYVLHTHTRTHAVRSHVIYGRNAHAINMTWQSHNAADADAPTEMRCWRTQLSRQWAAHASRDARCYLGDIVWVTRASGGRRNRAGGLSRRV